MKTFSQFLYEEKKQEKIPEFFVHYRSGKDKNHHASSHKKDDEEEFFAHYRSGKDKKHNPLDENFEFKHNATSKKELKSNLQSLDHHKDLMHQEIKSDKTKEHRMHVYEYTEESKDINEMLIKKRKLHGVWKDHVNALDKATTNTKNALKKPIKTYSGVGKNFAEALSKVKPGKHVKSSAYISTSLDHGVARKFAHDAIKHEIPHKHIIQFHLPAGYTKGRYIHNDFHANKGEHEFLMARGQKFKKIKETKIDHPSGKSSVTIHHLEPAED